MKLSGVKSQTTAQPKRAEQNKKTQSKPGMIEGRQWSLQCHRCQGYGHSQNVRPGKDQGGSTPVSQSNQKKTCAMVAKMVKRLARV